MIMLIAYTHTQVGSARENMEVYVVEVYETDRVQIPTIPPRSK